MTPHKNTALGIVLVRDERLLDVWLGDKSLVQHALDKLGEIRGLDVCVVVPDDFAGNAATYPWLLENHLVRLPSNRTVLWADNTGYEMVRWLVWEANYVPATIAHLLVLCVDKPLTSSSCLLQVFQDVRGHADDYAVITGRDVQTLDVYHSLSKRFAPSWGVWACHRNFFKQEKPHWCRNYGTIPLESVETLSMLDSIEERIIQTLVNQGQIELSV